MPQQGRQPGERGRDTTLTRSGDTSPAALESRVDVLVGPEHRRGRTGKKPGKAGSRGCIE
jgi:hypothetical protein